MNPFVFICGCARSGTSTTTELIRTIPNVAIGRERFNYLFKENNENLKPSLFTKKRFCEQLLAGDTHHKKLDAYYDNALNRWDSVTHLGDKIPSLFKNYPYLFKTFPNCKVIFLLRNCLDVCQSWENRRLKSKEIPWGEDRGVKEAVTEWNESLVNTLNFLRRYPNSIFILQYEDLYREEAHLNHLFHYLNIDLDDSTRDYWRNNQVRMANLEEKRTITLSSNKKRFIAIHADFFSYNQLNELSNKQNVY